MGLSCDGRTGGPHGRVPTEVGRPTRLHRGVQAGRRPATAEEREDARGGFARVSRGEENAWTWAERGPAHNRSPHAPGQPAHPAVAELTVMSFTRAATLGLLVLVMALVWPRPLASAPVPVRFVQGSMHGFLVLHMANGPLLASGDLLQVVRSG